MTNFIQFEKSKKKDSKHTRKHLGSSVCLSVSVSIGQSMSVFVCFFQSNVIFEQSNNITLDSQRAASTDKRSIGEWNKAGYTATPVACGWTGPYLRPLEGEASSIEAKDLKNPKKCVTNRQTDWRTHGPRCSVKQHATNQEKSRSQSSTFWHIREKYGFHFLMGKFKLSTAWLVPQAKLIG